MRIHFILAALLLALTVSAQKPPAPELSEEVEVSLVSLYAVVTDDKGKPVKGLEAGDFVLTSGGMPVEIAQFSGDPTEVASVAFLLDTSGSMRLGDKYDAAVRIIDTILEELQSEDEVSLITFSDGEVRTVTGLTRDKSAVSNPLVSQKLYGPTAIWDAILFTQKMVVQSYGKKAVVLISDGLDTRSENVFQRAVQEASKTLLPVYVCELTVLEDAVDRELQFESPLKAFAEATGALHVTVEEDNEKEIRKVTGKLVEEIRYQYYIGISGATAISSGLQLTTRNPSYRVRLRHSLQ